jgi:2-polyprenyl-6-methoxyphenol hydroxylase-like FAD-dependent oxidoreductase
MTDLKRVLIVGGGIGGMAAAIRFREMGVAIDLIDIDPDWKVYGAGITITGPTLRAYRQLNLLEAIKAQGAITNGSRIFRFDGLHLRDLDEPALEEGLPATGGIMRPVLHKIMQERVRALNTHVQLGVTVTALANHDNKVDVTFSNDTTDSYDLVVGADSVYSAVRALAFPHMAPAVPTGQGCWRIAMKRPPHFDRGEFYFGHKNPAGITACGPDSVYMWMLVEDTLRERIADEAMFDTLHTLMQPFGGNIGWMRENMVREDWINYRPLAAAIQPAPWHNGRIVLIGDAAHATTPHLASGAGIAVESALVLVEELSRANTGVEAGLEAYTARRFPRCKDVVETSVAVGALQLQNGSPEHIGGMIGGALHRLAAPY